MIAGNGTYRGEYPSKEITREFVWLQHLNLLGSDKFKAVPHVFLASRIAGDVGTLQSMGVPALNIWAVEKDRRQYRPLLERRKKEGFRLFPQKIESFLGSHPEIQSVYLDYCGNLQGTSKVTRRVVSQLPKGSALSITLFLGREHECPEDREADLVQQVRESTRHPVTVVQSIFYLSFHNPDEPFGVPMGTWSFFIGGRDSRSRMRFDLHEFTHTEIKNLTTEPGKVRLLWQSRLKQAEVRRLAAIKANRSRMVGASR